MGTTRRGTRRSRDRLLAASLGLAFGALYALRFQERWYVDGPAFLRWFEAGAWRYVHLLYLPFAHVLGAIVRPLGARDPETVLRLASILPGAAVPPLVFLAGRVLGATPLRSTGVALLLGLAPPAVFFATVVENHALHFACSALAFLGACGYARAPGPGRAALAGAGWAAAIAAHTTSALLGPGLLLLAADGARREGVRPRGAHLLAFAAPLALLGACVFAIAWGVKGDPFALEAVLGPGGRVMRARLGSLDAGAALRYLGSDFVVAPFLLFPLVAFGLGAALRRDRRLAATAAAFAVPYLLVMPLWGYPDEGSHFFPAYAGLLLPLLRLERRPGDRPLAAAGRAAALGVGALGILAQGARSLHVLADRNRENPEARWIEDVRAATGDEGVLLTAGYGEPLLLERASPLRVIEFGTLGAAADEAAMREEILARAGEILASGERLWLDGRVEATYGSVPAIRRHLEALRDRFEWTPLERGSFRGFRLSLRE